MTLSDPRSLSDPCSLSHPGPFLHPCLFLTWSHLCLTLPSQVDTELNRIQDSLKELFSTEIDEARRLLDETANQKAALELESGRHLDTIGQLRCDVEEKDTEISRLQGLIDDLDKKLANSLGDIKELKANNKRILKDNEEIKRQLTDEQNNRYA